MLWCLYAGLWRRRQGRASVQSRAHRAWGPGVLGAGALVGTACSRGPVVAASWWLCPCGVSLRCFREVSLSCLQFKHMLTFLHFQFIGI